MTDEIWGLSTCETCRKARAALPAARFRDLRAEPLTPQEIDGLLTRFGSGAVNRASTTWRRLTEDERRRPEAELLARHPALLKRPVIRRGADWHVGFGPPVRAALGLT